MTDLSQLASELSEAQRDSLSNVAGQYGEGNWPKWIAELHLLGLVHLDVIKYDARKTRIKHWRAKLTPLGLALRAQAEADNGPE